MLHRNNFVDMKQRLFLAVSAPHGMISTAVGLSLGHVLKFALRYARRQRSYQQLFSKVPSQLW